MEVKRGKTDSKSESTLQNHVETCSRWDNDESREEISDKTATFMWAIFEECLDIPLEKVELSINFCPIFMFYGFGMVSGCGLLMCSVCRSSQSQSSPGIYL